MWTKSLSAARGGRLESQYLAGSVAPFGHSTSSHSSGQGSLRLWSRCAGRTRTAAKREVRPVLLPSRQVTLRLAESPQPGNLRRECANQLPQLSEREDLQRRGIRRRHAQSESRRRSQRNRPAQESAPLTLSDG